MWRVWKGGVGILLSLGLHSYHCCDKMTDKGGKGLPWLTPREQIVHDGRKAWWQEREAAGHIASVVRKQRERWMLVLS